MHNISSSGFGKKIVDWELARFVGEEIWAFDSPLDAPSLCAAIRDRLSRIAMDDKSIGDSAGMKRLVGKVVEGRIFLRCQPPLFFGLLGTGAYFFEGSIFNVEGGCKIEGRYRTPTFSRIIMLILSNVFILSFMLGIFVVFYLFYESMSLGTFRAQEIFAGLAVVGIGIILVCCVWLLARWGKLLGYRNRRAVCGFLESVTTGH